MKREVYLVKHAGGETIFDFKPVRNGDCNKDLNKENQSTVSAFVVKCDGYRWSGWAWREIE